MKTNTLGGMVTDLRAEIGDNPAASQGLQHRPTLVRVLQRTQETLFLEHDWPALKIQRDIPLKAGQRYYDFPSDLDLERLETVTLRWGGTEVEVSRGIDGDHYSALQSNQVAATSTFTVNSGAAAAATGGLTITGGTLGAGNKITQLTVNGVALLTAAVLWGTSHSATAQALAVAINIGGTVYRAVAAGPVLTITADPNLGATANGYPVIATVAGTVTVGSVLNMSAGANNLVTAILAGGVNILPSSIGFRSTINDTAAALAAAINSIETVPRYTATADSNAVTIASDPQAATNSNGTTLSVTTAGTFVCAATALFAGGVSSQRADPAEAWDVIDVGEGAQIEIWPVPASASGTLRIYGIKALAPFVADADRSTLDATMVVLYAASELLLDKKTKRAQAVAAMALSYFTRFKGRGKGVKRKINLAGQQSATHTDRRRIRVAYAR